VQNSAFHAWHEFDDARVADVQNESIDDVVAQLAVSHLASAKTQACFHLVAVTQKADCLVLLGLVVVLVHGDRELDFLKGDDLLLLACGAFALFLFVEKAAVVLDAADRRNSGRRNFDQVEAALTGDFQRLEGLKDSKLFAIFVDDAYFAGANSLIDTDERLSCSFIECDGAPPRAAPAGPCRIFDERRPDERTLSIALA